MSYVKIHELRKRKFKVAQEMRYVVMNMHSSFTEDVQKKLFMIKIT